MERWSGRVAVVTGASSGIGAAVVKDLLKAGLVVVGLARRQERIEELKHTLPEEQQKRLHAIKCDVSSLESVNSAFDWIIKELGGVDTLINNAGTMTPGQLVSMDVNNIQNCVQVNLMGVVYCTRRAFASMKERQVDGHVVMINSILGHYLFPLMQKNGPIFNIYPSTKFAVTAATEMYRQEFVSNGTGIKVTDVSPGLTDTEIVSEESKKTRPMLAAEDVSQCVLFALSTPPSVDIQEIRVQPMNKLMK